MIVHNSSLLLKTNFSSSHRLTIECCGSLRRMYHVGSGPIQNTPRFDDIARLAFSMRVAATSAGYF
jgi:hypothetical protein